MEETNNENMENENAENMENAESTESTESAKTPSNAHKTTEYVNAFRDLALMLGSVENSPKSELNQPFTAISDNPLNTSLNIHNQGVEVFKTLKSSFVEIERVCKNSFAFDTSETLKTAQKSLLTQLNSAFMEFLQTRLESFVSEPQRLNTLDLLYEIVVEHINTFEEILAKNIDYNKFSREERLVFDAFNTIYWVFKRLLLWESKLDSSLSQRDYLREIMRFNLCIEAIQELFKKCEKNRG